MKTLIATALMAVAATAYGAKAPVEIEQHDFPLVTSLEPVDSIPALTRLHSWNVVDDDTLILWATPFKPYLVELSFPSPDLRFAWAIGVTSFGSRIHARFDSVRIDGFNYPIREIYELSREQAEAFTERS
ncbi:MAG TPA: DUF6491 family protein [Gammaproteobacteria bacterium]